MIVLEFYLRILKESLVFPFKIFLDVIKYAALLINSIVFLGLVVLALSVILVGAFSPFILAFYLAKYLVDHGAI